MRTQTVVGILLGGVVAILGGRAWAGKKSTVKPPYFEYIVKQGDTFSALGLRFFGDAALWSALLAHDDKPFDKQDVLAVGTVLHVPCLWYTVKPGDSLSKIAGASLGDSGRWNRIFEANRGALPDKDKLAAGMTLAIPTTSGEGVVKKPVPAVVVGGEFDLVDAGWDLSKPA